jgi:molecular chaperone GrpE (heat shock protein)
MQTISNSETQEKDSSVSALPVEVQVISPAVETEGAAETETNLTIFDQRLAGIESVVSELKVLFEERFRYDHAKEETLRMLSSNLEEITPAFHYSLKKGLINSLLIFYDHIKDVEDTLQTESLERKRVASLRQELLDRLYVEGVELIQPDSNKFNSRLQRATTSVSTEIPEEDLTIAAVNQDGFTQNEKIIRPQSVIIRRYQALT